LIRLRRTAPALRWGGFQLLHTGEHSVAFQREAPEQRIVVVARRAADDLRDIPVRHGGLPDGANLRELFSGATATVAGGHLPVSGANVQIWVADAVTR
jgi:alpha-glucosidase